MERNLVSEFMVPNPIKIGFEVSVSDISKIMLQNSISSVIITQENKPIGIITERDLVRRVLAVGLKPEVTTAKEICSQPVIQILIYEDIDVAVEKMRKNKLHRLVVVDQYNQVVGILTTEDIGYHLKSISEELAIKYLNLMSKRTYHRP